MEFLYEMNTNMDKSCEFNLIEEELNVNSEDENEDDDVDEVDWLFDTEWLIHCQLVEVRTLASFTNRSNMFLKIDIDFNMS